MGADKAVGYWDLGVAPGPVHLGLLVREGHAGDPGLSALWQLSVPGTRISRIICRAPCKVKMQGPLLKTIKDSYEAKCGPF